MGPPGIPKAPDAATAIQEAFLLSPAQINVSLFDAEFAAQLKYAYVTGMAEGILDALGSFALDIRPLDDEEMRFIDLSQFDAIVIGPNAYVGRAALAQNAHRFLQYAEQGGTLIVQFQGYSFERAPFSPYPFRFNHPHDRVTSELAEIRLLEPVHPVFHTPNTIAPADFEGWVHDRGMYFFGEWDSHYRPLMACHDHGEGDKAGGLLVASFGRGTYIYAAYSFHRQLPAGVSGAFRLFANLLAVPLVRILERAALLKTHSIFEFMNDSQLQSVARLMALVDFPDGSYLVHQGEPSDRMFVLTRGEVEIVDEDSGEVVFVSYPGELLGELGVLGEIPRVKGMRARGDVETLVIDGADFKFLMHSNTEISDRLIRMLVYKLANQGVKT